MKRILTILLAGTMMFSFTACGGLGEPLNESSSSNATEAVTEKENIKATIDDYIEVNKKSIDELKAQFEGVLGLEVYSENGDTLVYEYTYLQDMDDVTDVSAIEKTIDQSTAQFLLLIDQLKDYTGLSSPKVCARYCNVDGSLIFEKTYDENSKVPENASGSAVLSYKTLEEFVNSDAIQNSLATSKKQFEDVMDVEILAEGNSLIYQYKYLEQIPEDSLDTIAETLSESFEASESTFEYVADLIETTVGIDDATVVIRFLNADGKVFYEDDVA